MLSLLRDWRSPLSERLEQAILDKVCGYSLVQPRPCIPWVLPLENGRGGKKGALITGKKNEYHLNTLKKMFIHSSHFFLT